MSVTIDGGTGSVALTATASGASLDTTLIVPAGSAGAPSVVATGDTNTGVFFPAADTVALATGGSERARIDPSGNFGINTGSTIPKVFTINGGTGAGFTDVLQVSAGAIVSDSGPGITFNVNYGNYSTWRNWQTGAIRSAASSATSDYKGYLAFYTNNGSSDINISEKARIGSNGQSDFYGANNVIGARSAAAAGTSDRLLFGAHSASSTSTGTVSFTVWTNGNVVNTNNSYGSISDAKLKENVVDATPKLEKLQQVRVVNYNLIGETQKQIGVIAQELEQVFPGMVEESPDRDAEGNDLGTTTKSVKYSVFVPMLLKAVQELKAELDSVKAELAALKD